MSGRVALLFAIGALLCGPALGGRAFLKVFRDYPVMQCSACEMMAIEIGHRMNVTAAKNGDATIKKSHRGSGDGDRRTSYIGSELQAVEVLELFCKDVSKSVNLVETEQHVRVFSGDKQKYSQRAHIYGKKEQAKLSNAKARLEDFCEEVLDKHEGLLTRVIMKTRYLHDVMEGMCKYGMQLCDEEKLPQWIRDDVDRYEKFAQLQAKKGLPLTQYDDNLDELAAQGPQEILDNTDEM